MFASLLIANRGEIACRIIRTARRMGVRTIAVYSDADADALHVALADEAQAIGPAPARDSYLDINRIIAAARASGAAAIHPGYGFLSENADFAAACDEAGIVFVGPPATAIRAMGDKAHAKALMQRAGVPVVPGYHGAAQDEARFAAEARALGYPVLIKASAGGGGRGMRVVATEGDLSTALGAAGREAQSAFGDGRLIVEKYLARPRHIEVQIFADLNERDCSVQRRHQKVIEEAPAPGLAPERRQALGAVAVAAARAVGYVGAGTVEFVAEGDAFFFIEMNTRLQVEHPVTEMITGLDLVEWQLRVAAGEALPLTQEQIPCRGHAIEARLYAEDPTRDFLPAAGRLMRLRFPAAGPALRIETGVRAGDAVGVFYDPLLAKLVAWGEDRAAALAGLATALAATRIAGIVTNRDFLLRVVQHGDFAAGAVDTGFIPRHRAALVPAGGASVMALAAAALFIAAEGEAAASARPGDPHSPWRRRDGWRLTGHERQEIGLRDAGGEHVVRLGRDGGTLRAEIDGAAATVRPMADASGDVAFALGDDAVAAMVVRAGRELTIALPDETVRLVERDPWAAATADERDASGLAAPMPGKVLAVHVAPDATVKRGQLLMVIEAMKMEHAIAAPADGVVEAVNFAVGDLVEEGALLVAFAPTKG
jgi:3-methylcrotonyl-CoA carboxylase alpha subunit